MNPNRTFNRCDEGFETYTRSKWAVALAHGAVLDGHVDCSTRINRHVAISGTGRAGTTFIVALLTRLGFDTGFELGDLEALPQASHAGLEHDIRAPGAPYIVKSPWLCCYARQALARKDLVIEHAIIPLRDLSAAAASRARVEGEGETRGGLWLTHDPAAQADVLARNFHQLIEALVAHDVPITFVRYPRLTRDVRYLFEKLSFLVGDLSVERFEAAFYATQRPDWVHEFSAEDR